jgi:hypothetical protein
VEVKVVSKAHLEYRMIRFKPNVPPTLFSSSEIELLSAYGSWFAALMRGDIFPETKEQEYFVKVCHGNVEPESELEQLWVRYLKRKMWESENPDYIGKENRDLSINLGISNGKWGLHGRFK